MATYTPVSGVLRIRNQNTSMMSAQSTRNVAAIRASIIPALI